MQLGEARCKVVWRYASLSFMFSNEIPCSNLLLFDDSNEMNEQAVASSFITKRPPTTSIRPVHLSLKFPDESEQTNFCLLNCEIYRKLVQWPTCVCRFQ